MGVPFLVPLAFAAVLFNMTGQMWPFAIAGLALLPGAFFFVYRESQWSSVKKLLKLSVSARHPPLTTRPSDPLGFVVIPLRRTFAGLARSTLHAQVLKHSYDHAARC